MQVGIGGNRDSGLIAGYRSIAGRANYEVTKTVTDDHAVSIAQSATHQRMFVCDGLQQGPIRRREEKRKEFNCMQWYI